jgi:hypothetical protein
MGGGNNMSEAQNDDNEEMLDRLERDQEFEEDKAWDELNNGPEEDWREPR